MALDTVTVKKVHIAQLVNLLNLSCKRGAFELQEAHAIYTLVAEVQKGVEEALAEPSTSKLTTIDEE